MGGELKDSNGNVVFELNPQNRKGLVLDKVKVASAYGKENMQNFINTNKILYLNKDTKNQ